MKTSRQIEEAQAGKHGFDGPCAPGAIGAYGSQESFSVGVFEWLPNAGGKGCTRGPVKVRIKGPFRTPDLVFAKAREVVEQLDAGKYAGRKNVTVLSPAQLALLKEREGQFIDTYKLGRKLMELGLIDVTETKSGGHFKWSINAAGEAILAAQPAEGESKVIRLFICDENSEHIETITGSHKNVYLYANAYYPESSGFGRTTLCNSVNAPFDLRKDALQNDLRGIDALFMRAVEARATRNKIIDRLKAGARLTLDPQTGRYTLTELNGKVCEVDQRPVLGMIRDGLLHQTLGGECRLA